VSDSQSIQVHSDQYPELASHYSRKIAERYAARQQTDHTNRTQAKLKSNEEELAGFLGFKMINDPVNNLHIMLLEGPDSLINFALSKKFDEHLSLPWPVRRIWEELEYQWIITSQSIVQLPEHFPKNRPLGFPEYNVPKGRSHSKYSLALLVRVICFASP
jgi:hypothetical protein